MAASAFIVSAVIYLLWQRVFAPLRFRGEVPAHHIEFWSGGRWLFSLSIEGEYGANAREIVLRHRAEWPRRWEWAVVHWSDGVRQSTKKLRAVSRLGNHADYVLEAALSNSNSYSAPNFDIDTDTNVAGLTALKGSAPAAGDVIWVYYGATLTVEQDLACKQVRLGEMSSGAAAAGYRYGHVIFNAGVTVTWDGAASWVDSGIHTDPASADTSSLDCSITINGTSASPVTMTNSVGANNSSYAWAIQVKYGSIAATYLTANYYYEWCIVAALDSTKCNVSKQSVSHIVAGEVGVADRAVILGFPDKATGFDVDLDATYCEYSFSTNPAKIVDVYRYASGMATGHYINLAGAKITGGASWTVPIMSKVDAVATIYANERHSTDDIRPTEVVPAGFAIADKGTSGELTATWTNGASYSSGDRIEIWDDAEATLYAVFDATAGTGTIGGLSNGTAYTLKARATSDNYNYSDYSSTSTATPTAGTTPDQPTITAVTAGDGQFTVTVDVTNPTDQVYIKYYDKNNDTDWSDGGSRTGDGDVTVSGVTNGMEYVVAAYVNNGGFSSEWSIISFVMPVSAGTPGDLSGVLVAYEEGDNWTSVVL